MIEPSSDTLMLRRFDFSCHGFIVGLITTLAMKKFFTVAMSPLEKEIFGDTDISANDPKVWHQYTTTFLFIRVDKIFSGNRGVLHLSLVFRLQNFNAFHFKLAAHRLYSSEEFEEHHEHPAGQVRLLSPTGRLLENASSVQPLFKPHIACFWWLTVLNSNKIILDVFLENVWIPSLLQPECTLGNKLFFDQWKEERLDNSESFYFCGIYSALHVFPPFQKVRTVIVTLKTVEFYLNLVYSLTGVSFASDFDSFFLGFDKSKRQGLSIFPRWPDLHFMNQQTIAAYSISVHKYLRVQIVSKISVRHRMFDGPGVLSPVVNSTRNTYILSTFQCLLVILEFHQNRGKTLTYLQFQSIPQVHQYHETINKSQIREFSFPKESNSSCLTLCFLMITTETSYNFNVTISHMNFTGSDTFACQQGGLSVTSVHPHQTTESGLHQTTESGLLCHVHTKLAPQKRSIFSSSSEVYLIMYSHKEYGNLTVNVKIQVTKCKTVTFDPCLAERYCPSYQKWCFFPDDPINDISFPKVDAGWGYYRLQYKLNTKECRIIRVLQNIDGAFGMSFLPCNILLVPDKVPFPNSIVHQEMRIFFHSFQYRQERSRLLLEEKNHVGFVSTRKEHPASQMQMLQLNFTWNQKFRNFEAVLESTDKLSEGKEDLYAYVYFWSLTNYQVPGSVSLTHHVSSGWSTSWMDITHWVEDQQLTSSHVNIYKVGLQRQTFFLGSAGQFDQYNTFSTMQKTSSFLLNCTEHQCQKNNQIYFSIQADITSRSYVFDKKNQGLHWSVSMAVSVLEVGFEFDVPSQSFVALCHTTLHQNNLSQHDICKYTELFMMFGKYHIFSALLDIPSQACFGGFYLTCKYKTSSHRIFHMIAYETMQSWKYSFKFCTDAGQNLLALQNRIELEEFIALIKLSKDFPVLEGIFVGLLFNQTSKVGSF